MATGTAERSGAIARARVLDAQGGFGAPQRLSWADGLFEAGTGADSDRQGSPLWVTPGFVDAHAHLAWHAFDEADRARLGEAETRDETAAALARNLAAGFTSVRDAGGLVPGDVRGTDCGTLPRVQCSVRMLGRAEADAAGGLHRAVEQVLAEGAQWVKLVATASVASPAGAGLEPVFAPDEVRGAVRLATASGAGVMVHAWGGAAIDDAIEAGAASIEHGIFLTDAQARRAADRGLVLVPTLRIYRQVQQMIRQGSLPEAFRRRVDEAVAQHPRAVLRARDAGLALAVGTDSGTPEQHGSGAHEIAALIGAGLTPAEALLAATRGGAELLARVEHGGSEAGSAIPGAAAPPAGAPGTIAPGAVADAVVFDRDPREPGVLTDPDRIVAVVLDGRTIAFDQTDPTRKDQR
ncbi:amidohydrolase family protein [Leucobacter sp. gxy201]|uniref:amidohydrolase family protein n=1 Tax=Leucobacter sp. gxy201 TaxID=2957200 RepID=UPI003DA0E89B